MADDVTKRIIWQFSSTGADQVASDLNKINDEQQKLAVNTQQTVKASLDLEQSFDKIERRFDSAIRAEQDFAKVQAQVNAAVAQHPELQDRATKTLQNAQAYFEKAGNSASGYQKALDKAREVMVGFALEGGVVGGILGSFGPWGVAAAAGIGLVSTALEYMKKGAEDMGDTASKMKTFADNTGLTVTQIRGLNEAGAQAGTSADAIGTAMEKFTSNLGAARQGTGELYDGLQRVDRGLAEDIAASTSTAQAFDTVIKAINAATDATTKMNIARAAFGKGGASMLGVAGELGTSGVDAYSDAAEKASGVTSKLIEDVAKLHDKNKALEESNKLLMESFYAQPVLERQHTFLEQQEKILQSLPAITAAMSKQGVGMFGDVEAAGGAIPIRTPATNFSSSSATAADARAEEAAAKAADQALQQLVTTKQQDYDATVKALNEDSKLVSALGQTATAAQKAQVQLDALGAALIKGTISPAQYNEAAGAIQRQADAVSQVAQNWKGVSEQTALALQAMQNQLPVIQAINGEQQQAAQYAADYANALLQGKTDAEATALATAKLTASQAQATASVEKQVEALKDSTRMINAQQNGTEATTAAAIAYKNAIASGADATAAAALSSATLANYLAKGAASAQQLANAYQGMLEIAGQSTTFNTLGVPYAPNYATGGGSDTGSHPVPGGDFGNFDVAAGTQYTSISPEGYQMLWAHQLQQDQAAKAKSFGDTVAAAYGSGGVDAALSMAMQQQAHGAVTGMYGINPWETYGATSPVLSQAVTESDIIGQVTSLYSTKIDQATDNATKLADMNAEMSWLQGRGQSAQRDNAISQLRQSMDSLTKSTDSLNATNQELLSPYYTQDPRTSHIGFRSQGMAQGGYVDVPGATSANDNMIAVVPVASGERIYVDPMYSRRGLSAGANFTINISSPVMFAGNPNPDQVGRTMYQNNQNLAKQLRSAMQ